MTGEPIGVPSDGLLDALEVSVVVFDRDRRVVLANRRAREAMVAQYEPTVEALAGADIELLDEHGDPLPEEDFPSVRTLRTREPLHEFIMGARSSRTGRVAWVSVATQLLFDDRGEISGVICTFFDVTSERDALAALQASEERFRLLAENAADVVYRFSVGSSPVIDYVNPAVEPVLGYSPAEFYADPNLVLRITHEDDVELVRDLGSAGVDDVRSVQLRMIRRDGSIIWTEHRVVPLRDAAGDVTAVTGIARDVTALKAKEAYLSHRALHDPLTGLPNRVLLLDRLEAALARIVRHQGYLAVLYLDLDRFKTVNDNLGHAVGDRLLQVVGQRLQDTLRPSDSVARLGGDEFAAVLPDLNDPEEANQIAERLLAAIAEPVNFGDGPVVTTVSIGIACASHAGASAAELLRRADFAMYTAKDRGRARVESYEERGPGDPPAPADVEQKDR